MDPATIRRLQKRLDLKAGFLTGSERFALRVSSESDDSWWNHVRRLIQVGLKGVERHVESIGELLMEHEVGHVLHTSRHIDGTALGYPFSLLNILEDERVERLRGCDFSPLHEESYRRVYLAEPRDESKLSNPYNIGILCRWKRWGVRTETMRPAMLSEDDYELFVEDWENTIGYSLDTADTEEVSVLALDLYNRWKELFDAFDSEDAPAGGIEKSAGGILGSGEESMREGAHGESETEARDSGRHFGDPWFTWDIAYVEHQALLLRKLLEPTELVSHEYRLSGRRFDPRRIENPPLAPFRRKTATIAKVILDRMLVVIDGSGSMQGEPFRDACHMARTLSLVFPIDILITTTESTAPIAVPRESIETLNGYLSWGGGENYVSLGTSASVYPFTLFLTNACVNSEDIEHVKNTLTRITRLGAGYVGQPGHRLKDVFPRNFYSERLDQNVARMVALFLKRNFWNIQ